MTSKTHVNWSIETPDGKCPFCGDGVVLVVCGDFTVDEESARERVGDERYESDFEMTLIEPSDEITGHFCVTCNRLVSLSLNTQ